MKPDNATKEDGGDLVAIYAYLGGVLLICMLLLLRLILHTCGIQC